MPKKVDDAEQAQALRALEKLRTRQIVNFCRDAKPKYQTMYCESLIEHMSVGHSLTSFGAKIGVTSNTLNKWAKDIPEFNRAMELAKEAAQSMWEDIAMAQATGIIKGNGSTLQFMMKNRFGDTYKDKQEIEHKGDLTFVIDTGIKRDRPPVEVEGEVIETIEVDDSDIL